MMDIIKRFSVMSLLLLGAAAATQASSVTMPDFAIGRGCNATVELTLRTDGNQTFDYSGWQFDLFLPEGLNIESCGLDPQLSGKGFILNMTEHGNGAYRLVTFTSGPGFASEELMQITFNAADNAPLGEAKILIQNVIFSAPDGQDIDLQNSEATVTFNSFGEAETPLQLLRKGNGTSCTFICMMPISNDQLVTDGYRFVYGFESADGGAETLANTNLRYCHTTDEIFNDSKLDFWVFAYFTASDGSLFVSSRRHLDGRVDDDFNPVDYINVRNNVGTRTVEGVFTLDGRYLGKDASKAGNGIYILKTAEGSVKIIK